MISSVFGISYNPVRYSDNVRKNSYMKLYYPTLSQVESIVK